MNAPDRYVLSFITHVLFARCSLYAQSTVHNARPPRSRLRTQTVCSVLSSQAGENNKMVHTCVSAWHWHLITKTRCTIYMRPQKYAIP
jgi:hypothetical protein